METNNSLTSLYHMRAIHGYSGTSFVSKITTDKEEENKINLPSLFLCAMKDATQ